MPSLVIARELTRSYLKALGLPPLLHSSCRRGRPMGSVSVRRRLPQALAQRSWARRVQPPSERSL